MKSKINNCKRKNFIKETSKNNNKRLSVIFLKSQDLYISSIINKEKIKSINIDGKEKRKTKNITINAINSEIKQNIKTHCMKKQNISLCSYIKNKYNTSKKKNNIENIYTSLSIIKKKYIDEIKENINLMNFSERNKPKILDKKINSYQNSIKKRRIYNSNILFQTINKSLIHTNCKSKYNNIYFNCFLNDKCSNNINQSLKTNINYNSKNNSNKKINTNRRNKKLSNITISSDVFLAKKLIFSNHNINSEKKEKGQKIKINKLSVNTKKDNSSKLTNISSSDKNEISKKSPIDIPKKSYVLKNENFLKKNTFLERQATLKMTSEIYENDIQDYESKFLNYELGISDKVSTINYLDETIKKKEVIKNECEKPVEEIEQKAKEIYNSEYKYKYKGKSNENNIISNNSLNHINLNNDIEEFKEGEEIHNIFTLFDNKKRK